MKTHRTGIRSALAVLAIMAMATTASACGGGDDDSAGGKTLTMWTFKQSHVKALEEVAKGFTRDTGVQVRIQAYTPDDAYLTKVQAAAKTKDLPDLLEVHTNGDDLTFGAAGLVDDLAKDVDTTWLNSYLPQVRADGSVTDQYYKSSLAKDSTLKGIQVGQRFSVPLTIGTFGIVYADKKRLADAGITSAPTTWEEFVADLATMKRAAPTNGGVSLGLKSPSTGLEWFMQPMGYGLLGPDAFHSLWSKDQSVNFSSPAGRQVLETYGQVTPYWMPGTQSLDIDGADLAFAQGKSAFDIGGTFTLAFLAQNGFDPANVLAFPIPAPAAGQVKDLSLAPFTLTGVSVSATSRNRSAAIDWLKYLTKVDVAAQFAKTALDIPPVDLGTDPSATVGPVLGSMVKSFGSGPSAYNPGDTTYRPDNYNSGDVGAVLMNYTPLATQNAATTGSKLTKLIDSYWAQQ